MELKSHVFSHPALSILLLVISFFVSCAGEADLPYKKYVDTSVVVYGPYRVIKLPVTKGVRILNPIQLATGPQGKLFGANQSGEIYTLIDSDGDGLEDEAKLFCNVTTYGLRSPAGFAHKGDTIYIGTSQEIRAFLDSNNDGKADTSWIFFNDIPFSQHPYEWTCGMNFGPDGWLYFALSTDSWNAGPSPDPRGYRGSILRISPDGKQVERLATGIRSVYGTAFNQNGELFFTDNEGGGNSAEELNLLKKGGFYGHNPKKYEGFDSITTAVHKLESEVAPAGMVFNTNDNSFGGTEGNLFIAFYGPGERWKRGGVGRITIEKGSDGRYIYKEYAVADIPKLSALSFGKDGSLYFAHHGISDYWYNSIEEKTGGFYKMIYDERLRNNPVKQKQRIENLSASAIEAGKQLFAERACAACHATNEGPELLGPNVNGIGNRLSRGEILEEIEFPSKRIKPSMSAMRVTKKNGQVLLGRVVNAGPNEISLMLIGNNVVNIRREEILKTENVMTSLMYENLLNNLDKEQINNLLDYMMSLK